MQRSREFLSNGVAFYSDYSGVDFPREAVRVLMPAAEHALGCDIGKVFHLRACDIGEVQQTVLVNHSKRFDKGASCADAQYHWLADIDCTAHHLLAGAPPLRLAFAGQQRQVERDLTGNDLAVRC